MAGGLRPLEGLPVQVVVDGVAYDQGRMYRLVPGSAIGGRFAILEGGFTGPARRIPAGAAGLRVACLGDSTTFGIGAGPGDAYPRRLSDALGRAFGGQRTEVVNAGCPGYSSAQSLRLFADSVAPLLPSILVAYLGSNNEFTRASPRTDEEVLEGLARPFARLLSHSHLLRWLLVRLGPGRPRVPTPDFRERVPLERFEAHLASLAGQARAGGTSPLFIVPAFNPERRAAVPLAETYAASVRAVAGREGIPLLDPADEFRSLEPYPLYAEPIHLGRTGHRILTARLYDLLVTDERLASPFERAGLGALRAFEALAARSEGRALSEAEVAAVREGLAHLRAEVPEAALAHAVLSLGSDPGEALALAGSAPATREVRDLARALLPSAEAPVEEGGTDSLPLALVALARDDLVRASAYLRGAGLAHPYRPGIRRLLAEVERLRGGEEAAADARAQLAALRAEVVEGDPLEWALPPEGTPATTGALLTPEVVRGAALLLHRDRLHGGAPRIDRRIPRAVRAATAGRLEEGAALTREVLRTHPGEPFALALLARYHEMNGEPREAEVLWRRAVEVEPGNWNVRLLLARLEFERGERGSALAEVERVLEERPESADAWVLGLEIARALGDRERTERLLRGARDRAPDHPRLRELLAAGG